MNVPKIAVDFFVKLCYNIYSKAERSGFMPSIKPVSDLRNYNAVLKDVNSGEPVFLTKNGRGRYVILDIKDYEKTTATLKLMSELEKGELSAKGKGWIGDDEIERKFDI